MLAMRQHRSLIALLACAALLVSCTEATAGDPPGAIVPTSTPAPTARPTTAPTSPPAPVAPVVTSSPARPTPVVTVAPTAPAPAASNCDPSYPSVCIPRFPPDLDCGQITFRRFRVIPPDPHRFDADRDGIGCE